MLPPLVSGQSGQQSPPPTATQVRVGDGPLRIVSAGANQMFLDIKPSQVARLPRYKGELELTNHSAGSLTSQAYQKRWNRQNELLADAAEKASVAAEWLGGRPYPRERLNDAWTLVMGGHFHDILAGTATPKSYEYSWNDDVVAMNQFAGVLTSATAAISSGLNTQAKGTAIVVYNPLNVPREDVVEATISISSGAPWAIRVTGPDGTEVPAQLIGGTEGSAKVLFLARVPSVGYAIYDVQSAESSAAQSALRVTESSLENARYRVNVDQNGDVTSIFDKTLDKELLSAPTRLAFQTEKPHDWPAWNMDWADQQKPPRAYAQGPAKIRIVEKGPVRVALEVKREAEGSKFVQTIRLAAGDAGNRVEFANVIDWKTSEAALKATFPLAASNPWATYNWDVGTIERGNNDERKFEVASHQWVDLTDKSGAYGVTVLTDCKNASDKPNDNTLRLTLIYTPGLGEGNGRDYSDQVTQDWGHHEFVYGLAGHAGDWRQAETDWQAYRLNQPLMAFESPRHPGALGKNFSLLSLNNTRVRILALKKAEESDEVIVRIVEIDGKPTQNIRLKFAAPVIAAREVNGQEMPMGPARVDNGELTTSLTPYELRTFALRLGAAPTKVAAPQWRPVALPYDQSVATQHGRPAEGNFDNLGRALPAEMLPTKIDFAGIRFALASAGTGKPNAVVPRGQTIGLPSGKFSRLYVLTASAHGDQNATFRIGDKPVELTIEDWTGYIGQWDNRSWNIRQEQVPERALPPSIPPALATQMRQPRTRTVMQFAGHITPGFIKRASLAWFASHRHAPDGTNEPYAYSYLFAYPIDIPAGARTLTLPENANIRVLAVTVANESGLVRPAHPLYDTLEPNER
jgi:alpha-mannosidase